MAAEPQAPQPAPFRPKRPSSYQAGTNAATTEDPAEQIRTIGVDDFQGAAMCMAESFKDDALSRYFLDTPDRPRWSEQDKWDLHLAIMQYLTYVHCMRGIVTSLGPDNACVALWMPPGAHGEDLRAFFQSGLWRLHYKLSSAGRKRFFKEVFPALHDAKLAVLGPRDPSAYYLVYIGTRPSGRGRGYARRLIGDMTAKADAIGAPVYLESTSSRNVPLYSRLGFEVVGNIAFDGGRLPLDIMVREPRSIEGYKITARADSGVEMADADSANAQGANAAGTAMVVGAAKVKVHLKAGNKSGADGGAPASKRSGLLGLIDRASRAAA